MNKQQLREQWNKINWQLRQQNYFNENTRKQLTQQLKEIEVKLSKLEK